MNAAIKEMYTLLYKGFGPQGWWPIVDEDREVCVYGVGAPRNDAERFEIIVGCILTQNTQWYPNAVRALHSLKKHRKLIPVHLARSHPSTIAQLIRSAGYYNQKANRLHRIARFWLENPSVLDLPLEKLRTALLAQHGIGDETADSIILYAAQKPSFVVDTYTRRIMSRAGVCAKDVSYVQIQKMFHDVFGCDASVVPIFKEYHALLVELAKRHCRTTPECEGCPLSSLCKMKIKN